MAVRGARTRACRPDTCFDAENVPREDSRRDSHESAPPLGQPARPYDRVVELLPTRPYTRGTEQVHIRCIRGVIPRSPFRLAVGLQ
jgi:hypothetical protein